MINYSEALIVCICRDLSNIGLVAGSGIVASDLDYPYSEIFVDIMSGVMVSENYIKLKFNLDIDFSKYDNISIDDVIDNLLKIKKHKILKSDIIRLGKLVDNLGSNIKDVDKLEEDVLKLYIKLNRIGKRDRISDGNSVVDEVIDRYNKVKSGNIASFMLGLPTIDNVTGGVWSGELVSIVGRPGTFKTTFLTLMLKRAFEQGKKCLWINTEMSNEAIMRKLLVSIFGFDFYGLKKGVLTQQEEINLYNIKNNAKFDFGNIIFAGSFKMTVYDVVTIAIANKPDIIFIDSAYILRNEYKDRYDRISETVDILKQTALDLGCIIMFTHQLNREAQGTGKNRARGGEYISLETIGFSDMVACNTDFVFALYRTATDIIDRLLSVKALKIREGELVQDFKLDWDYKSINFGTEKQIFQSGQVYSGNGSNGNTDLDDIGF